MGDVVSIDEAYATEEEMEEMISALRHVVMLLETE